MHIIAEGAAADRRLQKEDEEQCLKHHRLGEEADDIGEGACHVIGVDAEKFAAERSGEGIQKTLVTEDRIAKRLIEIDVLPIEVKYKNAFISKRMHALDQIY